MQPASLTGSQTSYKVQRSPFHNMTQRHPGLLSLPSRSLPPDLPVFASSSSTISCGLMVMWTTWGVGPLSIRPSGPRMRISVCAKCEASYVAGSHLSSVPCHPAVSRNGSILLSLGWMVWLPSLESKSLAMTIASKLRKQERCKGSVEDPHLLANPSISALSRCIRSY